MRGMPIGIKTASTPFRVPHKMNDVDGGDVHDSVNIKTLLIEAKRVSNIILIKDHFEYGLWSRRILQLADFVGNYGVMANDTTYPVNLISDDRAHSRYNTTMNTVATVTSGNGTCGGGSTIIKLIFKSKYQFISLIH